MELCKVRHDVRPNYGNLVIRRNTCFVCGEDFWISDGSGTRYYPEYHVEKLLKEKDARIAQLEKELENATHPPTNG